jgi:hypothetical protein
MCSQDEWKSPSWDWDSVQGADRRLCPEQRDGALAKSTDAGVEAMMPNKLAAVIDFLNRIVRSSMEPFDGDGEIRRIATKFGKSVFPYTDSSWTPRQVIKNLERRWISAM